MIQTGFISHLSAAGFGPDVAQNLRVKPKKKGSARGTDAVYTNAPTQPQYAQAHSLCIARGKRNTHGVRTNG